MDLINKKCVPCEGGVPPFTREQIETYKKEVSGEWQILDGKKIERKFKFKDFKESMEFVNKVAEIAEQEQHHPDIKIFYSLVTITLWTHAIAGLSENDFIMAAKIDRIKTS
ncbi:MAG: 4a-hydroxytetrahydrobiopterin dehydratase [Candidatus Levyibacteriota bacterium]